MQSTPILAMLLLLVSSPLVAQQNEPVIEAADEEIASHDDSSPVEEEYASPLSELEWMIGKWIDQGDTSTITAECSWIHERQFLSRSFQVTTNGDEVLAGTQIIGWDPIDGRIRSWTFDSEGGRGEGYWSRDDDRWLIKTFFVLATGERASAINVITYVDENTLRWQSTNREIAGELQPNIPEVTVIRQNDEVTAAENEKEDVQ
jgi:hypothetical protein